MKIAFSKFITFVANILHINDILCFTNINSPMDNGVQPSEWEGSYNGGPCIRENSVC